MLTGAVLGLIVLRVRYLKPFVVLGTVLFLAAFGVLHVYRSGNDVPSHTGIVGAQILLGIGEYGCPLY